jgi:hypothetical protein
MCPTVSWVNVQGDGVEVMRASHVRSMASASTRTEVGHMSSSTRWTSRALVAAGTGGLLVLGVAFGAVGAASADDAPPATAGRERPGTLPPEPPTAAPPERPARATGEGPGTLPPAEPVPGVPNYTG